MVADELDMEFFEGAASLERRQDWVRPWRLPHERQDLFNHTNAPSLGCMQAGIRLRFATSSPRLTLHVVPHDLEEPKRLDLVAENELLETAEVPAGAESVTFESLPGAGTPLEIWFPVMEGVAVREIELAEGCTLAPRPDPRPKWITYGSSITHCKAAHSPARTWPATAARMRNLNLRCLGFGGQCHVDSMIARFICDCPADVISLKLGINVYGGYTLNPRSFRAAILGFVSIVREKHPDTPIALISPIISPNRETTENAVGFTLEAMREEVKAAAETLVRHGDRHLTYVNGLELFGPDLVADYLPDNLHPNGDGYEIMGRNAVRTVLDPLL